MIIIDSYINNIKITNLNENIFVKKKKFFSYISLIKTYNDIT